MPALPASTRVTTYEPTVPTQQFPVGFPIFDPSDLTFLVDGSEVPFTITGTWADGISENAVCNAAYPVTGEVHVVGSRSPRRTDQFASGRPLPPRDLNTALNRLTAEGQEARRDVGRSLQFPYGQTGGQIIRGATGAALIFADDGNVAAGINIEAENAARISEVAYLDQRADAGEAATQVLRNDLQQGITGTNAARALAEQARDGSIGARDAAVLLVNAAQAAYAGFQPGTFYDLGRVTDALQLFPSDLGRVTGV